MPEIPTHPTARARKRKAAVLTGLTAAVLLGHWAVLVGTALGASSTQLPSATERPFLMRTVSLEPLTVVPLAAAPVAAQAPSQPRAAPKPPSAPKPVEFLESNRPPAPVDYAQAATESIADVAQREPVELAAADAPPPTPTASPAPMPAPAQNLVVNRYVIPGSTRLKYEVKGEVKGFPYFANGELLWLHDGKTYDARLEISHFLLGARVQTSKGQITPQGLEPIRFGDKVRSEVAAHFEYSKGKVTFSANTPDAPLQTGAQDQLSVFVQLASLLAGEQDRVRAEDTIPFQAVGPRSSEVWIFIVGETETLQLPGGAIEAIKMTRNPTGEHDPKVEVWLAPTMDFMPARIRLSQPNGDFVEQQWRSTQKP